MCHGGFFLVFNNVIYFSHSLAVAIVLELFFVMLIRMSRILGSEGFNPKARNAFMVWNTDIKVSQNVLFHGRKMQVLFNEAGVYSQIK